MRKTNYKFDIENFEKGISLFKEDKEINEEIGRYKSWNIIYDLTKKYLNNENLKDEDYDLYTLNLCMYLASWRMYRGSTKLLQRFNYKALKPILKILLDKKN